MATNSEHSDTSLTEDRNTDWVVINPSDDVSSSSISSSATCNNNIPTDNEHIKNLHSIASPECMQSYFDLPHPSPPPDQAAPHKAEFERPQFEWRSASFGWQDGRVTRVDPITELIILADTLRMMNLHLSAG